MGPAEYAYDVSLLLAVHREGKYLLRTLQSFREAAVYASVFGLRTELVAALDRADATTVAVLENFDKSAFGNFRSIQVDYGSLGLTRNAGATVAAGKYICACDADDLISYNTIAEMYFDAERHGPFAVFFPQYVMGFGDDYHLGEYQILGELTAFALTHVHPLVSRIFAHRNLFAALKYLDIRPSDGYAYEDWHFNCEVVALGYSVRVTRDTILFYRRRRGSLLSRADVDSIRQIPPSRLFKPSIYLKRTRKAHEKLRRGIDPRAGFRTDGENILDQPICLELLASANRIEPAIFPDRVRHCTVKTSVTWFDIEIGLAYREICTIVGDRTFDDVFLFPYFGGGGAELFCLKILWALHESNPSTNILLLFGERIGEHLWTDQLPPSVTVVDLASNWPKLNTDGCDIVALKLLQSCAAEARIHVRQSYFGERFFNKFRAVLRRQTCLFYRFSTITRFMDGHEIIVPGGLDFVSENLEYLSTIIADNETIMARDFACIGVDQDKWRCLRVPHMPRIERSAALRKVRRAGPKFLWASRIAGEKRPSLLIQIASQLAVTRPEATIHAYGTDSFGLFDMTRLQGLPNLIYEGPFTSFQEIGAGDYAGFVYTSLFDGMPNVVLEAVSMGLPVIAPDVGGIAEIIIDGETGILLPSLEDEDTMAALYVAAIARLIDRPDLRVSLADAAFSRLVEQHSPQLFVRRLKEILGLGERTPPSIAPSLQADMVCTP